MLSKNVPTAPVVFVYIVAADEVCTLTSVYSHITGDGN